jgi:hypothetical protein
MSAVDGMCIYLLDFREIFMKAVLTGFQGLWGVIEWSGMMSRRLGLGHGHAVYDGMH